jgi:hypothetical protein
MQRLAHAQEMYRNPGTGRILEESYTFTIPGIGTVTTTVDRTNSSTRKDPSTSASANHQKNAKPRRWFPWWPVALLGIIISKRIADMVYLMLMIAGILALLLLIKDNLRLPNFRKFAVQLLDKARNYLAD